MRLEDILNPTWDRPSPPPSTRVDAGTQTGDSQKREEVDSPRQDHVGRTVHIFPDERGNHQQYYVVCPTLSCPYLGFETIWDIVIHLSNVHPGALADCHRKLDGGTFLFAIPEARIQEHERGYGLGSAGLPALCCPFDRCSGKTYYKIGGLRGHLTTSHQQTLGLPHETRVSGMAWQPHLNTYQETGRPHSLRLGPTPPLLGAAGDEAELSASVTRKLHPGTMLTHLTKTQKGKRKREPVDIIEISTDEDGGDGDGGRHLPQQPPRKRLNIEGNNPPLAQQA